MNNSRTIDTAQSSDLVTTKILVAGEELSATYQVQSIVIAKELNRIPYAQLVIFDGDAATQDFPLSNQDLLIPGKDIEIKTGYHNDVETLFKGKIIKHSIKIRESVSALYLECKDVAVNMTIGRKSAFYYDLKDSDIWEEIATKYELDIEVQPTSITHKELVHYHSSDWDFIMTRAQANGCVCTIDDGKLYIKKPDINQEPVETVAYGATLLDFDGEIDARNQFKKITAYSWNAIEQQLLEIESNDPQISLNGNLSTQDLAQVTALDNLELKHGGNLTDIALQEWGDAKNLFQQLARTRGRIKFQGIPDVKPDTILNLQGVGDRFNGKVYITAVQHEIAEGNWVVNAQFGLNPQWFSETYEVNDSAAAGLLPAINGLQVGIVSQLEDDPDGEDRILIKIPIVNKEEQGIWARIATLDAGNNRGSFFRPEIEDEVIVGFINDDPNQAVVLGMLNSSLKPAPMAARDDNHEKGFVTRSGLKILFDDDKSSCTLITPAERVIKLDDDAGEIIVDDMGNSTITLNESGILMESQKDINLKSNGDINLEGTNVNIKAQAQFKAEGTGGAEVSTSSVAVLKGSIVQIN